jgi:hypothetical protein
MVEVIQRVKEERSLLKILQNRCQSWTGHTIRHKFVANILQRAIYGKKAIGRPRLQYIKQGARNTGADRNIAMKRGACNNFRGKAANQTKDLRRRRGEEEEKKVMFGQLQKYHLHTSFCTYI